MKLALALLLLCSCSHGHSRRMMGRMEWDIYELKAEMARMERYIRRQKECAGVEL